VEVIVGTGGVEGMVNGRVRKVASRSLKLGGSGQLFFFVHDLIECMCKSEIEI